MQRQVYSFKSVRFICILAVKLNSSINSGIDGKEFDHHAEEFFLLNYVFKMEK